MLCVVALESARGGPNDMYSVVKLQNKTPYRIFYTYRWGNDPDVEKRGQIAPKKSYVHWWTFDYAGEDHAPWFYVQLDGEKGWYKLGSFHSADTKGKNGRHFVINSKQTEDGIVFRLGEKLLTK